jgi:hypothetical protein
MDTAGGAWAVGGDLTVDQSYGLLAYNGQASVARAWTAEPCAQGQVIPGNPGGTVSYSRQILPLFRRSGCLDIACHGGPPNPESLYDLRNYDTFFGPGLQTRTFGMCDIVPGNADASFIMEKLGPSPRVGARMPNTLPPLSAADMNLVRTWINEGAVNDTPLPGTFRRADVDGNGTLNITDPIGLLNHLFLAAARPPCFDAADANDDGLVNIADGIFSLNFQFTGGRAPATPFPGCGQDATEDTLDCLSTLCN